MGLFDKLFGNEEKKGGCCDIHIEEVAESQNGDSSQTDVEGSAPSPAQELVVMGPGCRKCHQLEENARAAVEGIARPIAVRHVSDAATMAAAGVMATPRTRRGRQGGLPGQGAERRRDRRDALIPVGKKRSAASAKPARPRPASDNAAAGSNRRAIIAVIMIAIVLVGAWAIKGAGEPAGALGEYAAGAEGDIWALEASSVSMSDIAAANVPAVIDFGSDSCAPCEAMAPVLEEANRSAQGSAIVKFVDVWKHPNAANGLPVQVIPTQLLVMPGGAPYVPSASLSDEFGLEFSRYDDESGNHAYTTHQGALTQEQMDAILADMGV